MRDMVSVCDFEYQKVIVGGLEGIKKKKKGEFWKDGVLNEL